MENKLNIGETEKVFAVLIKLFYMGAFAVFFWLLLNIILNHCFVDPSSYGGDFVITSYFNPFLLVAVSTVALAALSMFYRSRLAESKVTPIVLFTFILAIQIWMAPQLAYDISDTTRFTDLGTIIESAQTVLNGGTYAGTYYKDTPYQVGILSELVLWNQLLSRLGFHSFNANCIALNVLSIDFALLGGYAATKIFWKSRRVSATYLLLACVFVPNYTFLTYYYSDSLSVPFPICGICLYALNCSNGNHYGAWKKAFLWAGTIFVFVIGMMIKVTVGIAFIAILLHMVFSRKFAVKTVCVALCFIAGFLLLRITCYAWIDDLHWFDYSISEDSGYPVEFWILMGSNQNRLGAYPPEDVYPVIAEETRAGQREMAIRLFSERLKAYRLAGYLKFLTQKNNWMWGDGTYFSVELLGWFPHLKYTPLLLFFTQDGRGNPIFLYWGQSIQVIMLFLLVSSLYRGIKHGKADSAFLFHVSLIGMLLFFSLWEGRPRYLFNYTPFLLIAAANGLMLRNERGEVPIPFAFESRK